MINPLQMEEWKPVKGYEGLYEISSLGRLRCCSKRIDSGKCHRDYPQKILKPAKDQNGYLRTSLSDKNHIHKTVKVHRLVAEAFLDNPSDFPQVNHKDGNKQNNSANNLEWCDQSHNMKHAIKTGLKRLDGAYNPAAKLTTEDVSFIREHYKPRDKQFGIIALANRFNVHRKTIGRIIANKAWKGGFYDVQSNLI